MATEIRPINQNVRNEVRRHTTHRRLVAPASRILFRLFMMTLLAAGFLGGVLYLWDRAIRDPRFRMDGETVSLAGAVRECPESIVELERIGKTFNGRSLLDPLLISDMQLAYESSVWVKKITRMRRRFPNRMDVEFLLRLPAAQVWQGSRYWLVDGDGVLLPVPGSKTLFPVLPEIVGVTNRVVAKRPGQGEAWKDEGVIGALGILRAFWGSPLAEAFPVERIVVNAGSFREDNGGLVARRRFEVVSVGGAVVRWGTFNPEETAGELTSAEKLWYLQDLLRREQALRPGVCFDVRTSVPGFSLLD